MNIWVNGCFDILHGGHLDLLEYAKNLGDPDKKYSLKNRLIVGIDSDRRVQELKGKHRPINNENNRKRMLLALKVVDEVIIYDTEDEMCDLILKHNIDFMVIGDEYKNKKVLCRQNSKHGVMFFPKDERSSTNIIQKIKNS